MTGLLIVPNKPKTKIVMSSKDKTVAVTQRAKRLALISSRQLRTLNKLDDTKCTYCKNEECSDRIHLFKRTIRREQAVARLNQYISEMNCEHMFAPVKCIEQTLEDVVQCSNCKMTERIICPDLVRIIDTNAPEETTFSS